MGISGNNKKRIGPRSCYTKVSRFSQRNYQPQVNYAHSTPYQRGALFPEKQEVPPYFRALREAAARASRSNTGSLASQLKHPSVILCP